MGDIGDTAVNVSFVHPRVDPSLVGHRGTNQNDPVNNRLYRPYRHSKLEGARSITYAGQAEVESVAATATCEIQQPLDFLALAWGACHAPGTIVSVLAVRMLKSGRRSPWSCCC